MLYNDYVTGIVVQAFALVFEEEFDINRPFAYTIVKASSNEESGVREVIPFFFGHITNPEYWISQGMLSEFKLPH